MKVIEQKGKTVEGTFLILAFALVIVALVVFMRRGDSDYKHAKETSDDHETRLSETEKTVAELKQKQETFITFQTTTEQVTSKALDMMVEMRNRLNAMESKHPVVNVKMPETMRFNVLYKQAEAKAATPAKPTSKTPLLDKTGVTKAPRMSQ